MREYIWGGISITVSISSPVSAEVLASIEEQEWQLETINVDTVPNLFTVWTNFQVLVAYAAVGKKLAYHQYQVINTVGTK